MKKFFVPLFLLLLLSCSSEGFKSDIAASAQKNVNCCVRVDGKYIQKTISENLCTEVGFPIEKCLDEVNSSSSDEVSSSSRPSSSSQGSSSSRPGSSSSVGSSSSGADSSSSVDDDSSSSVGGSSSSSVGAVSSSSVGAGSSSSGGAVSSSSGGAVSSSSGGAVSSSSSESQEPPKWSGCNIPPYVGRNEPIANLKFISIENNNGRCGAITYRLGTSSTNVTALNYTTAQIGTPQNLSITASTTCNGTTLTQQCSKSVTVADYAKFSEASKDVILKSGKTIVDVGGVSADMFGCQARDNSSPDPSPNPFEGKTSFILNGVTVSVTDNQWWVKTTITANRMLFESNNANVGSYRCQIE